MEQYRRLGRLEGISMFPNHPNTVYTLQYWAKSGPFSKSRENNKKLFQFRIKFTSTTGIPTFYLINHEQWKGIHPNLWSNGTLCREYQWNAFKVNAFAGLIVALQKWVDEPNYASPTRCYRG